MANHCVVKLGQVDNKDTLEFTRDGNTILTTKLGNLLDSWKGTLYMGGEV